MTKFVDILNIISENNIITIEDIEAWAMVFHRTKI